MMENTQSANTNNLAQQGELQSWNMEKTDVRAWLNTSSDDLGLCAICNDKATGRHYGSESCDGCKGFFRRTIRKNQVYECRNYRRCTVEKNRRNACRFCRYQKCLQAGMRRDAVQGERDRIGKLTRTNKYPPHDVMTRVSQNTAIPSTTILDQNEDGMNKQGVPVPDDIAAALRHQIACILSAEETIAELRTSVISSTGSPTSQLCNKKFKVPSLDEICELIRQQFLVMVTWLKQIPIFAELPLPDQVALLRGFSADHLMFSLAYRSLGCTDFVLLFNESFILGRNSSEVPDLNRIVQRVMDELVRPMRQWELDKTEFCCLKAIAFFDPNMCSDVSYEKIKGKRNLIISALEDYVAGKAPLQLGRVGNLFMLLSTLKGIGYQFRESVELWDLLGIAKSDRLLQELLGSKYVPATSQQQQDGLNSSTAAAMFVPNSQNPFNVC